MTSRAELTLAGTRAVLDARGDPPDDQTKNRVSLDVAVAIEAVEGLIRADERGKWLAYDDVLARDAWADLQARVEALREPDDSWKSDAYNAALDDVLALLDGGSDE